MDTSAPSVQTASQENSSNPVPISQKFIQFFGTGIVLIGLIGSAIVYFKQRVENLPKNFDDCIVREGSKLQESNPPVCITREGNYFIQDAYQTDINPNLQAKPTLVPNTTIVVDPLPLTPDPSTTLPCKRTGCSGQLCVEMYTEEDTFSTCEYKAEYACYQEAPCERQLDGSCGFTPSSGLTACLQEKRVSRELRY